MRREDNRASSFSPLNISDSPLNSMLSCRKDLSPSKTNMKDIPYTLLLVTVFFSMISWIIIEGGTTTLILSQIKGFLYKQLYGFATEILSTEREKHLHPISFIGKNNLRGWKSPHINLGSSYTINSETLYVLVPGTNY